MTHTHDPHSAPANSAPHTPPNGSDNELIDLRSLLGVLRRQMRLIGASAAVILAAAGLYMTFVTPLFTATALVFIQTTPTDLLDPEATRASAGTDNARVESEVEILRSNTVAREVAEAAGLAARSEFAPRPSARTRIATILGFSTPAHASDTDAVKYAASRLQDATRIRRRGMTYLIDVSVTSENPALAADIANTLAQTYIDQQVRQKVTSTLAARDVIAERIARAREGLIESESAFDSYLDDNIAFIADTTGNATLANLRTARDELAAQIEQTETRYRSQLGGDAAWDRLGNATPGVLAPPDADLDGTTRPDLTPMRSRLAEMQRELDARNADLRRTALSADMPAALLTELFAIQQRSNIARTEYESLLTRLREVETQADLQVADARIVSEAFPPSGASFPNNKLVLALAFVMAAGGGMTLAFLREFYVGGFSSESQVEDVLGIPVAGFAPALASNNTAPADAVVTNQMGVYAESVRRLRASVDRAMRKQVEQGLVIETPDRGSVIMVGSTVPGEGKSTTSLALARTYALSGKKTLLIDADMRKPSIAHDAGLAVETGLFDYLSSPTASIDRAMATDPLSTLDFIVSAGRSTSPTDQLLSSKRFVELLDVARERYDVIVLDTPPLLPVVDGIYLAHHADAVIMILKWADTRQQDARSALQALADGKRDIAPVFAFLNHKQDARRTKGYNAYYGG